MMQLEHPEIRWIERTGYPSWNQPNGYNHYSCQMCGDVLDLDEVYEDVGYEYLCENCVLKLHKKEFNNEDFSYTC